jgi:enoyl-CoA hydratase
MEKYQFKTLAVQIGNHIAQVKLNNPEKANAMTKEFWTEIRVAMEQLDQEPECRVIILSGEGKHFTSGIDLNMFADSQKLLTEKSDHTRRWEKLRAWVLELQTAFTSIEKCRKPVLAMIHGACIGGGIDMITACDMRYCSEDAYFCVKEIDLAIVADVGTLQRLPKIISEGHARELAYTAKTINGQEAKRIHLVNECYATREQMQEEVLKTAQTIAAKSPVALRGTKETINFMRDHSVEDGLNFVATLNSTIMFSQDIMEAMMAGVQKRDAKFEN